MGSFRLKQTFDDGWLDAADQERLDRMRDDLRCVVNRRGDYYRENFTKKMEHYKFYTNEPLIVSPDHTSKETMSRFIALKALSDERFNAYTANFYPVLRYILPKEKFDSLSRMEERAIIAHLTTEQEWERTPERQKKLRDFDAKIHAGYRKILKAFPHSLYNNRQPSYIREVAFAAKKHIGELRKIWAAYEDPQDRYQAFMVFLKAVCPEIERGAIEVRTVYGVKSLGGWFSNPARTTLLNTSLFTHNTPDAALFIFFHEYNHSWQPSISYQSGANQLQRMNQQAYISARENYKYYVRQPLEVHADNCAYQICKIAGIHPDLSFSGKRAARIKRPCSLIRR